jgi:CheY-like chemotaxis protein
MISDYYASTSNNLTDILKKIFIEKRDPKEIGVTKLGVQITYSLLELLQVKFVSSVDDTGKYECGFLFPIKFKPDQTEPVEEKAEEIFDETDYQQMPSLSEEEAIPEDIALQPDQVIEMEEESKIYETSEIPLQEDILEPEEMDAVQEDLDVSEPAIAPDEEPQEEVKFTNGEEYTFEEVAKKQFEAPEDKLNLSNLNCLYIEDQVDSQILFKVQMKGLKDIKHAVSFEEALPLLDTEQFDFIVMDINLQGEYNGLDALKIIHKMPNYEEIPIIAVTAYVLPGDKEKFIATGFSDFISKPIFREKMIESLEKIFLQKA